MKSLLLLLAAALIGMAAFHPLQKTSLEGTVADDTGEVLIGAAVKAFRGVELMGSAITGLNGQYQLLLEAGTYDIEVIYTGYTTSRTTGVVVLSGKINTLDVVLASGVQIEAVTVNGHTVPLIERDKTSATTTLTSQDIRNLPARNINEVKSTTPASTPAGEDVVNFRGAREEGTNYYLDGIRVTGEIEPAKPSSVTTIKDSHLNKKVGAEKLGKHPAEKGAPKEELADVQPAHDSDKSLTAMAPPEPAPSRRAGLLTAGEWNDLHNWNTHWAELLADGETEAYQTLYKFYPKNRYAVLLQNEQGLPITDAAIKLQETSGRIIWETRTDNFGRAELWDGLYGETPSTDLQLRAVVDGQEYPLGQPRPFKDGLNRYELQRACQSPKNVDIVWTVDATGSMGDEIDYLKTELLDVIGRARKANPGLAVRTGSVFYRDQGDAYLVKSSPLTADAAKTVDYIRQQEAGGGGDWPEAVHSALEEAIFKQDWSESAVARICFLVLDASPHQDPDVVASLQRSIREAARRGIRIVPVSASGAQKDTEFLMKFFGLATNGTYVFLTDHSGIGGKHMEPTTDEYKVELLNDLLVRIITEYSTVETCEGKTVIRYDQVLADPNQNGQQPSGPGWQAFFYPNPASTEFSLDLPIGVQSVTLYDAQGKAVRKVEKPQAGLNLISVNDLSEGFYTIRIFKDGGVQSGKLMVVRG